MQLVTQSGAVVLLQTLIDGGGRRIDPLRVSTTDRCNFACRYCCTGDERAGHRFIDVPFAAALVLWLSTRHSV